MRRLAIIVIILLVAYLLSGCSKSNPGKIEGEIVEMVYWNYNINNNRITVYSDKYGEVDSFESPYFKNLRVGDKVVLACDNLDGIFGKPVDCSVVSKVVPK